MINIFEILNVLNDLVNIQIATENDKIICLLYSKTESAQTMSESSNVMYCVLYNDCEKHVLTKLKQFIRKNDFA